jgi:hypothetical protein
MPSIGVNAPTQAKMLKPQSKMLGWQAKMLKW